MRKTEEVPYFSLGSLQYGILFPQHHTGPSAANYQIADNPSTPPEIPAGSMYFKDSFTKNSIYYPCISVSAPVPHWPP